MVPPELTDLSAPAAVPAEATATTERQRARRDRIVHAALEMLRERPYAEIQIREVADRGGVALGTLYRYFPSKEQLFAHVLLEWASDFDGRLRRRGPELGDDVERLRLVLRRAISAFERSPNFFQLITVLEVADDPAVEAPFRAYSERFTSAIAEAVHDASDAEVEVITDLCTSLMSMLLRSWSSGHSTIRSVRTRADAAVELIFAGVSNR